MLSENFIKNISQIIEKTFLTFKNAQEEINEIYQKHSLMPSGKFSLSSELSFQVENAIIQNVKKCEKGKGFEDVLYNKNVMLEVKVSTYPSLRVNVGHKVCGKTYFFILRENLFPKRLVILPFAKDRYFKVQGRGSRNRLFDSKYSNLLIKINY